MVSAAQSNFSEVIVPALAVDGRRRSAFALGLRERLALMHRATASLLAALSIAPSVCLASPAQYSSGPTWGQVIDADTGKPISGALIIAHWDTEGGMERSRNGTFKVLEATTDSNGNFSMPAWGPEPASPRGELDAYDPAINIFKPGYTPEFILNGPSGERGKRLDHETHDWRFNGGVRKLHRNSDPPESYAVQVSLITVQLSYVLHRSCMWKEIPRTIRALEDEEKRELAQGLHPGFSMRVESLMRRKDCGSLDEFVKIYSETN